KTEETTTTETGGLTEIEPSLIPPPGSLTNGGRLSKAGKKRAQCGHPRVLLSHFIVPEEGAPDRLQQFLFQYRFDKEVICARPDRWHRHRNVAMTGYEDDGQPASEHCELILQLRSAQAGLLHIQQNTAAIPTRQCLQELLGRLIERNSIAAGP